MIALTQTMTYNGDGIFPVTDRSGQQSCAKQHQNEKVTELVEKHGNGASLLFFFERIGAVTPRRSLASSVERPVDFAASVSRTSSVDRICHMNGIPPLSEAGTAQAIRHRRKTESEGIPCEKKRLALRAIYDADHRNRRHGNRRAERNDMIHACKGKQRPLDKKEIVDAEDNHIEKIAAKHIADRKINRTGPGSRNRDDEFR